LISGSIDGMCILWNVHEGDIHRKWTFCHFESSILDIFIQDESKVAAISSEEGKLVIYNLYTKEIFRVLFNPDGLPINRILLSFQPFGSVIYYSEQINKLYVYSVNGQKLSVKKFKASKITDLALSSDCNNMEFLVAPSNARLSPRPLEKWV
jgi:WD40 repeat protein